MRLQSELLRGQPRDAPEPGRERLIMRNEYISTHAIRVKIIVSRRSVVAVLSSSFLPPPPPFTLVVAFIGLARSRTARKFAPFF